MSDSATNSTLAPSTERERLEQRTIVWFSCGIASACAANLALQHHKNVYIVNCDTRSSEHPDNYRFSSDVEQWLQHKIIHLTRETYKTIDDVFNRTRFMSSLSGARCTIELKK